MRDYHSSYNDGKKSYSTPLLNSTLYLILSRLHHENENYSRIIQRMRQLIIDTYLTCKDHYNYNKTDNNSSVRVSPCSHFKAYHLVSKSRDQTRTSSITW